MQKRKEEENILREAMGLGEWSWLRGRLKTNVPTATLTLAPVQGAAVRRK